MNDTSGFLAVLLCGAIITIIVLGILYSHSDAALKKAHGLLADAHKEAEAQVHLLRKEANAKEEKFNAAISALQAHVDRLAPYQGVIDAEARAKEIVKAANQRAEQIAGAALETKRKATEYQRVVEAMRNVIEGYGDRYVIPVVNMIDELAEQYGFAEAGRHLKEARVVVRQMIKDGTAATSNFVGDGSGDAAIRLVIDAFNGKVDSALSEAKEENYGTLEQQIRDAFRLVNHGATTFRNARISREYLGARLEELKWLVAVYELRAREREEQRLIKERIREEEKAQREFDRARKEAEKEEDVLRRAMEKAHKEIDRATGEQRAQFEEQLRALEEKLKTAEEKNQRALSMAQQTKSGHVYVISNYGSFGEHVYKIGLTRRLEPLDRIRELGDASVPFEFDVHALIRSEDAPALEHQLHKRFAHAMMNKANPRKEFFRVVLHEIREEIDQLGLDVVWTMEAARKEWLESQAIEKKMLAKEIDEDAWAREQVVARDSVREPAELVE